MTSGNTKHKSYRYSDGKPKISLDLSKNEVRTLLVRALTHYETRLKNAQTDQDILKFGIDIVKDDLENNIKDSEQVRKFLGSILKEDAISNNDRRIICLALSCYIIDLKSTIETTKTKLNNLNLTFDEIQTEIEKADEMRDGVCPEVD
jgi:hypothetical protein